MRIKSAITAACLVIGSSSTSAHALDVGVHLNQCLEAVTNRDVTVFGDLPTIVTYGEPGDVAIRRLFEMDTEATGVLEMGFAITTLDYDPIFRTGADCAVTMVLNDAATQEVKDFRKWFDKYYGPVKEREKGEYSGQVDEFACLKNDLPLRLGIKTTETKIRVSIWDSIPERPGC